MNKPIAIIIALVAAVVLFVVPAIKEEYAKTTTELKSVLDEAKKTVISTRETSETIRKVIEDFRSKLIRSEQDASPLIEQPKIVMHSGVNCEACKKWKRDQLPKWEQAGWQIEVVEEEKSSKTWPWYEVCENDKCYEVIGPLTAENLEKARQGM